MRRRHLRLLEAPSLGDSRVPDRIWAQVTADKSGCWLWGGTLSNGYGRVFIDGKHWLAHRYVYLALAGDIPEGLVLDHLCRVTNCLNPAHMEPVTDAENIRRGFSPSAENNRKTHCPQGHPLTPDNIRNRKDGRRACRICYAASMRRMNSRKRAARDGVVSPVTQSANKPTELAITLATFPGRYDRADAWTSADEVRGRLKLLGFECKTQQVAAWLRRMSMADAPWVERRYREWGDYWQYRVTNWGRNDIDNRFPGVRPSADFHRAAFPSSDAVA